MAEYQRKLESAADALARKQLGIEPKKDGVEEQERLPEIYEKFKQEYLSVLEDSFTEVCAQMKMQLGVKHLSDDTMLIIANKINDKAISGDLKFVSDLSQDKEIVAAVADASRVQRQQTEATNAIEGEYINDNGVAEGSQIIVGGFVMAEALSNQMQDLNDRFRNFDNQDFGDLKNRAKEYLGSEEKEARDKNIDVSLIEQYHAATTQEEKDKIIAAYAAREHIRSILSTQMDAIIDGQEKVKMGAIYALARNIAADEKTPLNEILLDFKSTVTAFLSKEDAKPFIELIEKIEQKGDRDAVIDGLVDEFCRMGEELGIPTPKGPEQLKKEVRDIAKGSSKRAKEELEGLRGKSREEVEEHVESKSQGIKNKLSLAKINRTLSKYAKGAQVPLNIDEIENELNVARILNPKNYAHTLKNVAKAIGVESNKKLFELYTSFAERDKQEREAQTVAAEEVTVEEPTTAEPTAPKIDFDDGPVR